MTTQLIDNRQLALRIGFQATDWTKPISYETYEQVLKDWAAKAIIRDGICIGAAYFKDGEVHASILPEWRRKWATKGILKQLLSHDNARTKVTPGHEYMCGILERLGFTKKESGEFVKEH